MDSANSYRYSALLLILIKLGLLRAEGGARGDSCYRDISPERWGYASPSSKLIAYDRANCRVVSSKKGLDTVAFFPGIIYPQTAVCPTKCALMKLKTGGAEWQGGPDLRYLLAIHF